MKLDRAEITALACKGMTQPQIAHVIGCSVNTLQRRYSSDIRKGYELRNGSIQQKMTDKALAGDTAMLIFLAKNWLGMADKREETVTHEHTLKVAAIEIERARALAKQLKGKGLQVIDVPAIELSSNLTPSLPQLESGEHSELLGVENKAG